MSALFACSKCYTRHPFEELSVGQQLCKDCRGSYPLVKCTYCRSEFQQCVKGLLSGVCKKCESNVKTFGKPSACAYCNIIAAFIGNKCQRCTNTEKKYGPPVACEQCKQKCAFDRKDEDKKIDGKLLCWLCTLSYKRALAKAKRPESEKHAQLKPVNHTDRNKDNSRPKNNIKRPRPEVTINNFSAVDNDHSFTASGPPNKVVRQNSVSTVNNKKVVADPNSSDHMVAMTQLREQIVQLQKQITQKDSLILTKDKYITELKAKHFTVETDLRNKMKNSVREHEGKVEMLLVKIKTLQKEVAVLTKTAKKRGTRGDSGSSGGNRGDSGSSGSRTNSPLP